MREPETYVGPKDMITEIERWKLFLQNSYSFIIAVRYKIHSAREPHLLLVQSGTIHAVTLCTSGYLYKQKSLQKGFQKGSAVR